MRRPALIRQSALITREERFWRAPSQGGSRPRSPRLSLRRADYFGDEGTRSRRITIPIIRKLRRKLVFQGQVCSSHVVMLTKMISEKHPLFVGLV